MSRRTVAGVALIVALALTPAVAMAQDGGTATPTPTPTATATATPTPAGDQTAQGGQSGTNDTNTGSPDVTSLAQRAEVSVTQLPYIDSSVKRQSKNGTVTYIASGSQVELLPQNVDRDAIVSWGVAEAGASLQHDKATGEYILQSDQAGTYTVWWRVSRTIEGENGTAVERVRYAARVQLRNVNYVHLTQSTHEQLRSDAENWTEVVSTFSGVGPAIPIQEKLQKSLNAWLFLSNPIAALQGDFIAALITLTFTNGGRLLLALLLAIPIMIVAPIIIKYRRMKKEMPDLAQLDREKLRQWRRQKKATLVEQTPHDVEALDARTADKLSEKIGENLWQISNVLHRMFPDSTMKRIYVRAMLAGEWVGASRTKASDGDDEVFDVDVVFARDRSDLPGDEDWSRLAPADVNEDIAGAVEWDEIDTTALDDDTELETLAFPLETRDDLLSTFDVDIPEDFETREQFAEALWHCCRTILSSEHTDEDGYIRRETSFLNLVTALVTTTGERYDVPMMRRYRDLFLYIRNNVDTDDDIVQASEETGYGDFEFDIRGER